MKKIISLAILAVLVMAAPVLGANTRTAETNSIMMILDGTTDYDSKVLNVTGLYLTHIIFLPSAAAGDGG
jgi:hypothetical protein